MRSGIVNTVARTSAKPAANSECDSKNSLAQESAAITLSARETSQTTWLVFDGRLATIHVAITSMAKLYGQMIPNTKPGGCQARRGSERYHSASVATMRPEPIT